MTQSEIYRALDKIYTQLQRLDELNEQTQAQRIKCEDLEQRAGELEAMKY